MTARKVQQRLRCKPQVTKLDLAIRRHGRVRGWWRCGARAEVFACRLRGAGDEALFAPASTADGGKGVGEGWALFAAPGAGRDGPARPKRELLSQQGDKGEQTERARHRSCNGLVRPAGRRPG